MSFQLTGHDPKVGNARSFIHAKVGLVNKICLTNLAPVACSTVDGAGRVFSEISRLWGKKWGWEPCT